jgi:hypothetical protein
MRNDQRITGMQFSKNNTNRDNLFPMRRQNIPLKLQKHPRRIEKHFLEEWSGNQAGTFLNALQLKTYAGIEHSFFNAGK